MNNQENRDQLPPVVLQKAKFQTQTHKQNTRSIIILSAAYSQLFSNQCVCFIGQWREEVLKTKGERDRDRDRVEEDFPTNDVMISTCKLMYMSLCSMSNTLNNNKNKKQ